MRGDLERIRDIEEAIAKIEKYSCRGKDSFFEDELIQTWIIYHLQIIGEAVRTISLDFTQKHNQIQWRDIADFRNIIVHEYFRVNLKIIWLIIENELPKLKVEIIKIINYY